MKPIQIKNNIINLNLIRKISYTKLQLHDYDEPNNFDVEFTFSNGDIEKHEMTYDKFQHLIEICDDKMTFVIDDTINTRYAHELK